MVLENGPVPLRILESLVADWVHNHQRSGLGRLDHGDSDRRHGEGEGEGGDQGCVCPPNAVVSSKCSADSGVVSGAGGGPRAGRLSVKTVLSSVVVAGVLTSVAAVRLATGRSSSFMSFVDR